MNNAKLILSRNAQIISSLHVWLFNDIIVCGMMPYSKKNSDEDVLTCKDTYFFVSPLPSCQITSGETNNHLFELLDEDTSSQRSNCAFLFESRDPLESFLVYTRFGIIRSDNSLVALLRKKKSGLKQSSHSRSNFFEELIQLIVAKKFILLFPNPAPCVPICSTRINFGTVVLTVIGLYVVHVQHTI